MNINKSPKQLTLYCNIKSTIYFHLRKMCTNHQISLWLSDTGQIYAFTTVELTNSCYSWTLKAFKVSSLNFLHCALVCLPTLVNRPSLNETQESRPLPCIRNDLIMANLCPDTPRILVYMLSRFLGRKIAECAYALYDRHYGTAKVRVMHHHDTTVKAHFSFNVKYFNEDLLRK